MTPRTHTTRSDSPTAGPPPAPSVGVVARRSRRVRRDDVELFAARAGGLGFNLHDLTINFIELRERDQTVCRWRYLRDAVLEIARAEDERAQPDRWIASAARRALRHPMPFCMAWPVM